MILTTCGVGRLSSPEPDWDSIEYESEESILERGGCVECGADAEDPSLCDAGCECAACLDYLEEVEAESVV